MRCSGKSRARAAASAAPGGERNGDVDELEADEMTTMWWYHDWGDDTLIIQTCRTRTPLRTSTGRAVFLAPPSAH